ncbi:hypothetical protein [Mariniluteicoccus flavus]
MLIGLTLIVPLLLIWGPARRGSHAPRFSAGSWRWGVRPGPGRWFVVLLAQGLVPW